jgi:DNA-binding MurR/RpiR family transcriptional regulator
MPSAQLIVRDLSDTFEALPPRMQVAARWVLDHPDDVALLSMRDQARRAGVQPATLTRLAQRLGFKGFEEIRRLFAASVRQRPESFQGRAEDLIARRAEEGDGALAHDLLSALTLHHQRLLEPASLSAITDAAQVLAQAERVFCIGLRSSFPAAYLFHYVRALIGDASILIDGAGGIGVDALRDIRPADAVLAVSVQPYTRLTIDAVHFAGKREAAIVAVTDSPVSPLARAAHATIFVGTETPSFFHTMSPAFSVIECLAALTAARKGPAALAALSASEDQLAAFDTYLKPKSKRPGS